jgi:hypothetical protein
MFRNKKHCDITLEDVKKNLEAMQQSIKAAQEKAKEHKEILLPVVGKKGE